MTEEIQLENRTGRRMPGPAEAGLLFSVMAIFQLYGGRLSLFNHLSDSGRIAVAEVLFIALPPLLFSLAFRYNLKETFRLKRPRLRDLGVVILISPVATLAAYSAGVLAIVLVRLGFGTMQISGDIGDVMNRGLPLAVVTIGIFPAICEEWMFRGFFQRGMEGFGTRWGVLLSGVLFGLFHFDFQRLAAQTLLGLVMAYVVYRTGSIFNAMLLHFLHNAGSVILAGFSEASTASVRPFLATASGDVFSSPIFLESAERLGLSADQLLGAMGVASAILLLCSIVVLLGLLLLLRHVTSDRPLSPPGENFPKRTFLAAVPGLTLILLVNLAIALSLMGHPAAKTILLWLHVY